MRSAKCGITGCGRGVSGAVRGAKTLCVRRHDVSIAEAILKAFPKIDDSQRVIVGHTHGPLLVIAGPGSGKTFSLVLRTMNLVHRVWRNLAKLSSARSLKKLPS